MITTEEFMELDKGKRELVYRLATVDSSYASGLVKIKFDGESTLTTKGYMFLKSYTPLPNDRVLLVKVADTYIILGKIVSS